MENTEKTKKKQRRREDNLIPYKPGQSGNPAGRPKGSLSLITLLKQQLDEIQKTQTGDKRARAETLVRNIVYAAINERDKDMIKLIFNYIEGMPRQGMDIKHEVKELLTQEQIDALLLRRTRKDNAGGQAQSD